MELLAQIQQIPDLLLGDTSEYRQENSRGGYKSPSELLLEKPAAFYSSSITCTLTEVSQRGGGLGGGQLVKNSYESDTDEIQADELEFDPISYEDLILNTVVEDSGSSGEEIHIRRRDSSADPGKMGMEDIKGRLGVQLNRMAHRGCVEGHGKWGCL